VHIFTILGSQPTIAGLGLQFLTWVLAKRIHVLGDERECRRRLVSTHCQKINYKYDVIDLQRLR
jgi:hypothetical protein